MGSALFAHGCVWGRLHQGFENAAVGKPPLSSPQEEHDGDHGESIPVSRPGKASAVVRRTYHDGCQVDAEQRTHRRISLPLEHMFDYAIGSAMAHAG